MFKSQLDGLALSDGDGFAWSAWTGAQGLDFLYDFSAFLYCSEHHVAVVKPWSLDGGDEELAAIGVLSSVGHWQAERFVLELEVFVSESFSPNRSASSAISSGEVTTLDHKLGNYSVELAAFEGEFHAVGLLWSFTESNKVFDCFGCGFTEHANDDVSGILAVNIDGESDSVSDGFLNKAIGTV